MLNSDWGIQQNLNGSQEIFLSRFRSVSAAPKTYHEQSKLISFQLLPFPELPKCFGNNLGACQLVLDIIFLTRKE